MDKNFPGPDGLHVGEMAEELAEREAFAMPIQELLAVAQDAIRDAWLKQAQDAPDSVVEAYKAMRGAEHD